MLWCRDIVATREREREKKAGENEFRDSSAAAKGRSMDEVISIKIIAALIFTQREILNNNRVLFKLR
jgi:hypothetical protein